MSRHAAESFDAFDTAFYPEFGLERRRGQETFVCDCGQSLHGAMTPSDLSDHRKRYHQYCGQCQCEPCECQREPFVSWLPDR